MRVITKDIISKLLSAGFRENLYGDYFFKSIHKAGETLLSPGRDAIISITHDGVIECYGNDSDLMKQLDDELKNILGENEI